MLGIRYIDFCLASHFNLNQFPRACANASPLALAPINFGHLCMALFGWFVRWECSRNWPRCPFEMLVRPTVKACHVIGQVVADHSLAHCNNSSASLVTNLPKNRICNPFIRYRKSGIEDLRKLRRLGRNKMASKTIWGPCLDPVLVEEFAERRKRTEPDDGDNIR